MEVRLHAQGERYSVGYFVWPRYGDMIQGPKKVHPPTSFARFMEVSRPSPRHPHPSPSEAQLPQFQPCHAQVKSKGFGYTLSPSVEQFEHANAHKVVLGMPHVTAAA